MPLTVDAVPYTIADAPYEGVLVRDPAAAGRPAVLMAPDWMGVREGAVAMARAIAELGATVFVADIYGRGRRPASMDEAAAMSGALKADPGEARRRIAGALDTMRAAVPGASRQAAVGFCFGGMNVLELARTGADIPLFVSIHGDLASTLPAAPGAIRGTVMVIHGAADPIAPKAQRDSFEAEMESAGATWLATTFGRAVHSFTDPGAAIPGVAQYDAFAAGWTLSLLDDAFKRLAN